MPWSRAQCCFWWKKDPEIKIYCWFFKISRQYKPELWVRFILFVPLKWLTIWFFLGWLKLQNFTDTFSRRTVKNSTDHSYVFIIFEQRWGKLCCLRQKYSISSRKINYSFLEQNWSKKSSGDTKLETHCNEMIIKVVILYFWKWKLRIQAIYQGAHPFFSKNDYFQSWILISIIFNWRHWALLNSQSFQ